MIRAANALGLAVLVTGATAALAAAKITRPEGPIIPEGMFEGCQLMKAEQPYPSNLKRDKVAGQVLAEVEVNKSGKVANVVILSSKPEGAFDRAAKEWFTMLRCPKGVKAGFDTRFQFLLVFNMKDNLGDPIDAMTPSWIITAN